VHLSVTSLGARVDGRTLLPLQSATTAQPKQKKLSPVYDMHHNFEFLSIPFLQDSEAKNAMGSAAPGSAS
jgi:hypothetical protein